MIKHHHKECITCQEDDEYEAKEKIIRLIISIILLAISFILKGNIILIILSYIVIGYDIMKEAIGNLMNGFLIDETFLMTTATLGAIAIGEYYEAVIVMILYQIGEFLQDKAVDHSKKHIKDLMNIKPEYARVKRNNTYEKVSPKEVLVGDIILVKPGEKVPLDGMIIKGNSYLDTFSITGESVPRYVKEKDNILSGCINQNSVLEIKVTCLEKNSTVNKILELIENATDKKANHEKFITRFARVYTPIVISLAISLAILPPLILHQPFTSWIYKALSFLVISCPCALVISVPLAFFAGIGLCAKKGIIVKGSIYLEEIPRVKKMLFDKTGTLTKGVFDIQEINAINIDKDTLLEIVATAEYYSNHPIATSIKKYYGKKIEEKQIEKIEELAGLGIKATISGKEVLVGNQKLMKQSKITYTKYDKVGTIIYVAIDKTFSGTILISDKIKENVEEVIDKLKNEYGITTYMLTGDKKEYAEDISKKIHIDYYEAELLPQDKVKKIKEIKKMSRDELVVFMGDGINDAPVLSLSDIGISMGGVGSDAAIEASDIIFMEDKIDKLLTLMSIAMKTLKIAKQNIIFSIGIKVIILLLSALGLTSMWWAIFADVGVSILAILYSLRVLK